MKKLLFTLSFSIIWLCGVSQAELYQKIKAAIIEAQPGIMTDNRLIAFNLWSVEDAGSREANKSFEKVYKVYEYAKLKGGLHGIIVVTINKNDLSNVAAVAMSKDGVTKLISLRLQDLNGVETGPARNMVFNSSGQVVYQDLPAGKIFESINQLITR